MKISGAKKSLTVSPSGTPNVDFHLPQTPLLVLDSQILPTLLYSESGLDYPESFLLASNC